jgi:hypothetical protein
MISAVPLIFTRARALLFFIASSRAATGWLFSKLTAFLAPLGAQDALRVSVIVKRLPASTRLAKPNKVNSWAVFFAKPG